MDVPQPELGVLLRSVLCILGGILLYWYSTRNHDYWKKRGIPFVPTIPFLGSLWDCLYQPMTVSEQKRYEKYGRLYGHYEGSKPVLSIARPELVKEILVNKFSIFSNRRNMQAGDPVADNMVVIMEGLQWKRMRTFLSPLFSTGKIKEMVHVFENCAKSTARRLLSAAEEDKSVVMKSCFGELAVSIITNFTISVKMNTNNPYSNKFVLAGEAVFGKQMSWRLLVLFLFPNLMKLLHIRVFSPYAFRFFKQVIVEIMQKRKEIGQRTEDFLQLLMDSATEESENLKSEWNLRENNNSEKNGRNKDKIRLSVDEIVAQCATLFLAGYDTTASSLTFVCYNLALHPDCQERVIREVDEVIEEEEGHITYEGIKKMEYLDNVIMETLRLYLPAVRIERLAAEDFALGDTGLIIPKGMLVSVPICAMHTDPESFPDPDKFDPDRHTCEGKASRVPYSFLPFGVGPRQCLGMRFAMVELKVCLAYIFRRFRFRRCSETTVPVEHVMGLGLQTKEIILKPEARDNCSLKD